VLFRSWEQKFCYRPSSKGRQGRCYYWFCKKILWEV